MLQGGPSRHTLGCCAVTLWGVRPAYPLIFCGHLKFYDGSLIGTD